MTTNPTAPPRWRPRFSLRALVILVTLLCCYAACWGPTKQSGPRSVWNYLHPDFVWTDVNPPLVLGFQEHWWQPEAIAPFLVATEVADGLRPIYRQYYFWFFGYVAKLPVERKVPLPPPPPIVTQDASAGSQTVSPNSVPPMADVPEP